MELVKRNLHQMCRKSEAVSQVTFDEDFNVPDAKPDVGRMIQKKGEVEISDVQVSEGKARVFGSLVFHLLYVADDGSRRIHSLKGELPIDETINLDGLLGGDKVCLKWDLEDLTIHRINSRKLNIRSVVTFDTSIEELRDTPVPVGLRDGEGISMKKKELRVLELGVQKKDTLRIKETVTLASNKPNIHEILWKDMEVRGLELRPEENKINAKGELFLFCLYAGDDGEQPLQWVEQAIPFHGEVECSGCTAEMIPNIEASMIQANIEVQPDADGEERTFQADAVLELDMKLYQEETLSLLQDVYTPKMDCVPVNQEEVLENLLIRNYSKCRVGDRISVSGPQNRILQLCHSDGKIKLDEVKLVENGIQVQGIVELRILYIVSDDDMPFYAAEAAIPFTHVIEAEGIDKNCRYYLRTDLEQLSATMLDSNEIEAKAVINLNAIVLNQQKESVMQYVQENPLDREKIQNMPGIVCYMVQSGDTLWDIAKKFYTTTDEIRELNNLKGDEIRPMQSLLLVKSIE